MKEQTGETYQSSQFAKGLTVAENKTGKTSFLISQLLGVFPGQKMGGVVSKPQDLWVLSADASALSGVKKFLVQSCNAPAEALKFHVLNFEDDARRIAESTGDYDHSFYMKLVEARDHIASRAGSGVPAILASSLTGFALAIERALMGPPTGANEKTGKGYGDMSKWKMLSSQLMDLQNKFQVDRWHMFWEGHIYIPPKNAQKNQQEDDADKETLQVSGKAGQNFAYNVEQVFKLRRNFGAKVPGTQVDQVWMDTRPTLGFIANGRGFTENLEPKEYDLTVALKKLGLKVGHWGAKSAPPKPVAQAKVGVK